MIEMILNQLKEIRTQVMKKASNPSEWTQEALGQRVGVSRRTIIAIERGVYNPTLELAFRLARELSVSVIELFSYRSDEDEE
jgi:putative transcriptional regulator